MRLFVLATPLLAACSQAEVAPSPTATSACTLREWESARFTVCDPADGTIHIVTGKRRLTDVDNSAGDVRFAMNGGMFDDAGSPIGLTIENGEEVHKINRRRGFGNFHLLPNGVFLVRRDGSASVVTSDAFQPADDIAYATQSGPMLLIDGKLHPKIDPDGQSHFIRNAVGIAPDGRARFVISDDAVSFGRLARFMRDELGMKDALFLDGSVSSLWDPEGNRLDNFTDLGPMIVVRKASSASAPRP